MQNQKTLVLNFIPLAHKIAFERARKLPKRITIDELKSAAYMGLVDAASKSDGSGFSSYASLRINGEITDYLRSLQWGPRGKPMLCFELSKVKNVV